MLKNLDCFLFAPFLIIFSLGVLILFSINIALFKNQLVFFSLGLVIFFIFSRLDYQIFSHFSWHLYILSVFLLLLTFVLGTITRGSVRWIKIGNLNLQPSELVKPFLILSFAGFASKFDLRKVKNLLKFLALLLLPVFLIFKQPDLGSAIVVLVIGISIIFVKGIKKTHLFLGLILLVLLIPLSWRVLKQYQRQRIVSFLNPHYDPLGSGYNLIQSKIAVGSGQFFGKGLGGGGQSQLRFLPESHSDFIFAGLSEELGFIGGTLIILTFFIFIFHIFNLSKKSVSLFGSLFCAGAGVMFFFQSFVNIGMNLGMLPITGITLPLVSYGGSSLISSLIILGLLQSAAKRLKKGELIEIR